VIAAPGNYVIVDTLWHPLLVGSSYDGFEFVRRFWNFVVLVSWLIGLILLLVAIVVAITGRGRTSLSIGVTGILLIAAGALVGAVGAANSYHLCAS
jgi:hypothetical protein